MNLSDLAELQARFDERRPQLRRWSAQIDDERVDVLEFLITALAGEVGELANITKKIARGDTTVALQRAALAEEMSDVFIYLIKLSRQLEIDLERAYLEKLAVNGKRFIADQESTPVDSPGTSRSVPELFSAKYQSVEQIRDLIDSISESLDDASLRRLLHIARNRMHEHAVDSDAHRLAKTVLLGIVAADIGTDHSPSVRGRRVEDLQLAAAELGIGFESVVDASRFADEAMELLTQKAVE